MKSVARNVIYEKRHKKHKKRASSTLKCLHGVRYDTNSGRGGVSWNNLKAGRINLTEILGRPHGKGSPQGAAL